MSETQDAHPSTQAQRDLPSIFDPSTCTRKGLCPVTKLRHQSGDPLESHSLYFEQHGSGSNKLVFIMGLNSSSFAWAPQVDYFGRKPEYSVLVFDNRGVGNSGTPRGPYSTSGMAEDIIALLDYISWTEKLDIHVIGVSLGGMIAQELATRVPERIISLILAVTTAGGHVWNNLPPWKGFSSLTRLTFMKDPEAKIPIIHDMVFPQKWLNSKAEDDPEGRTNRELMTIDYRRRMEITRPQTFFGTISQMIAGMTHHVSPARLNSISKSIPKVVIITGDEDHLVSPKNSFYLKKHMPEAEFIQWKETGHGIHMQQKKMFNELIERVVREGKERIEAKTK
ncbi:alpha/beta-hydrolase [Panus rudis PR-1116 ss-1]|nr:alpha/beta-hydrolase [Panus rudis PR-1116 ss-1]